MALSAEACSEACGGALPQGPSAQTWEGVPPREANAALAAMGQALARLYRFPMGDAEAQVLASLDPDDENDMFMGEDGCRAGAKALREYFASNEPAAALRMASDDFHKLFVGPLTLRAVPWSSAYIDSDALFGPTARAVRDVFASQGFVIPEGRTEPSDHVAYELQFLAEMHERAQGSWGPLGSPSQEALAALQTACDFKRRFMDPWVDEFLGRVDRGARVDAYRGVADLTRGFLALEGRFLEEKTGAQGA